MKRNPTPFIMSLVSCILGAVSSGLFGLASIFIVAFTQNATTQDAILSICGIIILAYFIGFIFNFFYFKKPKLAGIFAILCGIVVIGLYSAYMIILKVFDFKLLIFTLPAIVLVVSGILALVMKTKPTEDLNK